MYILFPYYLCRFQFCCNAFYVIEKKCLKLAQISFWQLPMHLWSSKSVWHGNTRFWSKQFNLVPRGKEALRLAGHHKIKTASSSSVFFSSKLSMNCTVTISTLYCDTNVEQSWYYVLAESFSSLVAILFSSGERREDFLYSLSPPLPSSRSPDGNNSYPCWDTPQH